MQTFLPYPDDFAKSASVLDTKRLVKQLLECRQIMTILAGETKAWRNHPAVLMWKYHEDHLFDYSKAIAKEMQRRGFKFENNWAMLYETYHRSFGKMLAHGTSQPAWITDDRVAYTHKGRLYEKAPDLYPQFVDNANYMLYTCCKTGKKPCTYFWPTHTKEYTNA